MPTIIDELTMTLSLDPAGYKAGAEEAKSAADNLLQKMLAVLAQIEQATKQTATNTAATTTAANNAAATSSEESARRQIDAQQRAADEAEKAQKRQLEATETAADRIVAAIKETEREQADSGKRVAEHTRGNSRQMEDHFGKVSSAIRRVGVEMLALLGISLTVKSVENLFASLNKTNLEAGILSKSLGVSVKDLTAWQNAASSLGTTSEGVTQFFSKTASELEKLRRTGQSNIGAQFRDFFGINIRENGKDKTSEQLLIELATKAKERGITGPRLQGMLDEMGYGAIAPMIERGPQYMLERKNLQIASGNVTTPEAAKQADQLNTSMQNVKTTLGGIAQTVMNDLSPVLTGLVTKFNDLLTANKPFIEGTLSKWIEALGKAVLKLAEDFVKFMQGDGFNKFAKDAGEFANAVKTVADVADTAAKAVGGWNVVLETLALFWLGGKVGKIIGAMSTFGGSTGLGGLISKLNAAAIAFGAYHKAQDPETWNPKNWDVGSPFWKDMPKEQQLLYPMSPASQERDHPAPNFLESPGGWIMHRLGLDRQTSPALAGILPGQETKTQAQEEARLAEVKRLREAAEAQRIAAENLAKAARDLATLNTMDEDAPGREGGGTAARGGGSFQAPTSTTGGDVDVGKGTIEDTGLTEAQYTAWRQTLGMSESGNVYSNNKNPKYKGKYQMGFSEIRSTALSLGEMPPTIPEFLNNPDMQERYFKQYTLLHHNELMKHPKYRAMSAEDKAGVRTAAHLAGVQGAISWMEGRDNPSDKNNTTAQQYFDMGRNAVRNAPAPSVPKASKAAEAIIGGSTDRRYAANDDLMVPEPIGAATSAQRWRMSSTNVTRSHNSETNIAAIHVHTQATDAAGIARDISGELRRFNYVSQADTGLA